MSCHSLDFTILSTRSTRAFFWSAEMPGGATTERQLAISRSMPCSFTVGPSTFERRFGDVTQLARFDLAFELAVPGDAGRHLAAENRCEGLSASGKRHIVDLGGIRARGLGEEGGRDMVDPARRAAGPRDLAGVRLDRRREILGGLDGGIGRHDDRLVLRGEARD